MPTASTAFGFHIHHIFPRELFDNPETAAALNALFAGQPNGLFMDMQGNNIAGD